MSHQCHVCCPVKHEAPTVLCAPCALDELERGHPVDFVVNDEGGVEILKVHPPTAVVAQPTKVEFDL